VPQQVKLSREDSDRQNIHRLFSCSPPSVCFSEQDNDKKLLVCQYYFSKSKTSVIFTCFTNSGT
jgi:hypothetical protein